MPHVEDHSFFLKDPFMECTIKTIDVETGQMDPNLPVDVYLAQGLEFEPGDVRYRELVAFFHNHGVFTVGHLAQHERRCQLLTDALSFVPARDFYDFRLLFKEFCRPF